MQPWLIEPRDPLIVRDGRPFDTSPGSRARTLGFPLPSTVAGVARTRAGLDGAGRFAGDPHRLLEYRVRGPLLVAIEGEPIEFFAPAPADAVMMNGARVHRLRPEPLREHELTNLDGRLQPMFMVSETKGKPEGMPAYWRWEYFERWLLNPADAAVTPEELGTNGPVRECRTHVAIQSESLTAVEGALFQTSGLEFHYVPRGATLHDGRRLAIAIETDAPIRPGLAPLAGERRLVCWRAGAPFPGYPPELPDRIARSRACRLVLLTPAYFSRGYLPEWICSERQGVTAGVKAAAVNRPVVASGWDLKRGTPKPTRRLAPAGSAYFMALQGDEASIRAWVQELWMQSVSDDEQGRRDGFGLAAIGVWEDHG
jgi:CRISPR-associated protein Cmr3